ncbi:MAG: NADPH-dependent FMN reductase [Thermoleophilia bacterium]
MTGRSDTPDLVAVIGSATPPGRLHRAVTEALGRAAERRSAATRLIDLGTVAIAAADGRPAEALGDDTAGVIEAIAAARAVALATPIYRGSLTGTLKNLLDHLPVPALRDTPVAIVAMGASDHHYLGAERHLRDILSFFGAIPVPTAAYLTSADFADGVPGERAAGELDAALDAALALAAALDGVPPLGPAPLTERPR